MLGKGNLGIRIPGRKHTTQCEPVQLPVPERVTIPLAVQGGSPSAPVVKKGDEVAVGQLIATPGEGLGVPVYASVSGKVDGIETIRLADGAIVDAVVILSDGNQTVFGGIEPPKVTSGKEFIEAVRNSGLTGLSGSGFPSWAKLAANGIDTILLDGMEDALYSTADHWTMVRSAADVLEGARMAARYLNVDKAVLALPEHDAEAISALKAAGAEGVELHPLPERYPLGEEKLLTYVVTGKCVPRGKTPADQGVMVMNVSTAAFLARYLRTGMPMVSRTVTVDGSAVQTARNFTAPLGTPVSDLFAAAGGLKCEPTKVVCGGALAGPALPGLDFPLRAYFSVVLALDAKDGAVPTPGACIHCGRCVRSCPMGLMPTNLVKARQEKDLEALDDYKADMCLECGICAYVCPAQRDLVTSHRLAKQMLKGHQAAKQEVSKA